MARRTSDGQVAGKDLAEGDTSNDTDKVVGEYTERPYSEALTDEHRKVLEEAHQLPKE